MQGDRGCLSLEPMSNLLAHRPDSPVLRTPEPVVRSARAATNASAPSARQVVGPPTDGTSSVADRTLRTAAHWSRFRQSLDVSRGAGRTG
jgi:hypothetical protein